MDAASPTSSITEHSASGVVNVLKIAQDWQQKQKEKNDQQQDQDVTEQIASDENNNNDNINNNNSIGEKNKNSPKGSTDGVPLILKPQDLHQRNILSDTETKELFVEMCFYARLGFVQPPCCLLCTYQETMEKNPHINNNNKKKTCPRWVIWRQNAETALHPNKLDGNLLITKCHVAQSLLQGNVVEGYAWDSQNKVVTCSD